MKTINKKPKINIVTLGCSKNTVDSEVLSGILSANGLDVHHQYEKDDYDSVIINTCGFINDAKEQSIDTILEYVKAKKQGLIKKIYVMGCLSQRYKNDLIKEIPDVDKYYGVNDLKDILKDFGIQNNYNSPRLLSTPKHYAYLKIAEGCNKKCSYCAIPLIRGRHISRPMESIIDEAKMLVDKGVKEILLISQDPTYYGMDLYKKQKITELAGKISDIKNLSWLRLHYNFPSDLPDSLLDLIKDRKNICKYIDIPLQHISDNILKSMKRGVTKQETYKLIEKIKNRLPEAAIRTTFIVGYPGETEENFQELKKFIKETRFDRLGVFTYSHEEGTYAGTLNDDVPEEIKQARAEEIMNIQQEISYQNNLKLIGQNIKVLFDKIEGDSYIGRTEFDSPDVDNEVILPLKSKKINIGEFSTVRIESVGAYDLFAK
ncbi:MAG: 30S ribosomal protein S12 methylthiotransferase RimO [Bacteroidales bacterium]|nr:30S ribosomal protein S12 methylthiotransferase RimO [Bacteroidales bacterium]